MPAISKAPIPSKSTRSTAQPKVAKAASKAALPIAPKTRAKSTKPQPAPVVSTGFWLMKSEPDAYSIEDLQKDGKTLWTGVRNYQARNFMMTSMNPGDQVIFYHSNAEPSAAVGLGVVLRTNLPDVTALDSSSDYHDPKSSTDHPIWFCAEIGFKKKFTRAVSLEEMRSEPKLSELLLLKRGQRLSIQPVERADFEAILKMGSRTK